MSSSRSRSEILSSHLFLTLPTLPIVANLDSRSILPRFHLKPKQNNDTLVKQYGVKLAIEMVSELVSKAKVEGIHFCTLNLERSVRRVLEGLNWIDEVDAEIGKRIACQAPASERNQLIEVGSLL